MPHAQFACISIATRLAARTWKVRQLVQCGKVSTDAETLPHHKRQKSRRLAAGLRMNKTTTIGSVSDIVVSAPLWRAAHLLQAIRHLVSLVETCRCGKPEPRPFSMHCSHQKHSIRRIQRSLDRPASFDFGQSSQQDAKVDVQKNWLSEERLFGNIFRRKNAAGAHKNHIKHVGHPDSILYTPHFINSRIVQLIWWLDGIDIECRKFR